MSQCVAYGCSNRTKNKPPGITFHKFPKDEHLKDKWVRAIRRHNWLPTKWSRLCSEHFSEDAIDRTSLSCVRLRENAVPSIFNAFPDHLQKKPSQRKPPVSCRSVSVSSQESQSSFICTSPETENIVENQVVVLQPVDVNADSPDKSFYKRKIDDLNETIHLKDKKIKTLQQAVRRIKRHLENVNELYNDLKEQRLIDGDALELLKTVSAVNEEFLTRQLASVVDEQPLPRKYA